MPQMLCTDGKSQVYPARGTVEALMYCSSYERHYDTSYRNGTFTRTVFGLIKFSSTFRVLQYALPYFEV